MNGRESERFVRATDKIMKAYSGWNLATSLMLGGFLVLAAGTLEVPSQELVFLGGLALWHLIYCIWFWKGSHLRSFAGWSGLARIVTGIVYGIVATHALIGPPFPVDSEIFYGVFVGYLLVHGTVDMASGWTSFRASRRNLPPESGRGPKGLEAINRLVFGIYMVGVGGWILVATSTFLWFFELPGTVFPGFSDGIWPPGLMGPIHVVGIQVLVLAFYNFTAVYYRLTPLIEAGMRGGLATCAFFVVLVVAGILEPITLALPAADFVSIGVIATVRSVTPR